MKYEKSNQWLQKHHPTKITDIVGNARVVRRLKEWLHQIQAAHHHPSTHSNADAYEPIPPITFLYGPGGIGKTCIAETVLKHFNYHIYELNAGEIRSKKRIQNIFERIMNNCSVSIMKAKDTQQTVGVIMDEIDGMSCGDKGGLHELFNIIKHHKEITHPVICISNRPYEKKLNSELCQEFQMRFPTENEIHKRLRQICKKEAVTIDDASLQFIVTYGRCDVRRTVHFLQEVIYSTGSKQSEIKIEDIKTVIEASSAIQTDFNIFDTTRNIFNTPLSYAQLVQSYANNKFLLSMMIYENLPDQLLQKKMKKSAHVSSYTTILHNLCLLDKVDASYDSHSNITHASLCCGYTNHLVSAEPTQIGTPKKITSTNTLTKIANHTCVTSALVSVSKQLRLPITYLHMFIPLLIQHIAKCPADVQRINVSFPHLEKIIQIYNKWVSEISKSEQAKCVKILPRMKKMWKEHLRDNEVWWLEYLENLNSTVLRCQVSRFVSEPDPIFLL